MPHFLFDVVIEPIVKLLAAALVFNGAVPNAFVCIALCKVKY